MKKNKIVNGLRKPHLKSCLLALLVAASGLGLTAPGLSAPARFEDGDDRRVKIRVAHRNVRVTAASVDAVPPGKKYEIDLRTEGVVYDLNPERRPISYSRVMIRTASGVTPIASFLKQKLPQVDLRGWESKRVLLVALAGKGIAGRLANAGSDGPSRFSCGAFICSCTGDEDCNDMFTTNVCGDFAFCDAETDKCYCSRQ